MDSTIDLYHARRTISARLHRAERCIEQKTHDVIRMTAELMALDAVLIHPGRKRMRVRVHLKRRSMKH